MAAVYGRGRETKLLPPLTARDQSLRDGSEEGGDILNAQS